MSEPPGLLARRAVHQYRRRDAVAHAALRHHLRAACARRDGWAERVDARLVTDRAAGGYLLQRSFKETGDDGGREYRPLHLPGPSEIMAEAALLRACAEAGGPFEVPTNAYSYRLAEGDKDYGVFVPYWEGYTRRQEDVREACRLRRRAARRVRRYSEVLPVGQTRRRGDGVAEGLRRGGIGDPLDRAGAEDARRPGGGGRQQRSPAADGPDVLAPDRQPRAVGARPSHAGRGTRTLFPVRRRHRPRRTGGGRGRPGASRRRSPRDARAGASPEQARRGVGR